MNEYNKRKIVLRTIVTTTRRTEKRKCVWRSLVRRFYMRRRGDTREGPLTNDVFQHKMDFCPSGQNIHFTGVMVKKPCLSHEKVSTFENEFHYMTFENRKNLPEIVSSDLMLIIFLSRLWVSKLWFFWFAQIVLLRDDKSGEETTIVKTLFWRDETIFFSCFGTSSVVEEVETFL